MRAASPDIVPISTGSATSTGSVGSNAATGSMAANTQQDDDPFANYNVSGTVTVGINSCRNSDFQALFDSFDKAVSQ